MSLESGGGTAAPGVLVLCQDEFGTGKRNIWGHFLGEVTKATVSDARGFCRLGSSPFLRSSIPEKAKTGVRSAFTVQKWENDSQES